MASCNCGENGVFVLALNRQSKALAEKLKAGKKEGWHVLNNIKEVKADQEMMALLKEIVTKNDQIIELFEQKGSLIMDFDKQPKSYDRFYQHHLYIKLAISGPDWDPSDNIETFPTEFDDDIEAVCKELHGEVIDLLKNAYSELPDHYKDNGESEKTEE